MHRWLKGEDLNTLDVQNVTVSNLLKETDKLYRYRREKLSNNIEEKILKNVSTLSANLWKPEGDSLLG